MSFRHSMTCSFLIGIGFGSKCPLSVITVSAALSISSLRARFSNPSFVIGFGNCSTTLGHALSYVFSNEGVPHGYSLSSCTTVAHKFNKSIFYERFREAMTKLGFENLALKEDVNKAADTVMTDKGHLDPNPIPIKKEHIIECLNDIKAGIF